MVCNDLRDEIFEAALSGAAPAEKVKAHISSCAACEKEYESLRSTMNVLDDWTAPEPSPYFDVRLRARLREVQKEEQEQHGRSASWLEKLGVRQLTWKPIAAVSFALMMVVGGGLYEAGPWNGVNARPKVEAACPVVDLKALDQNQQVLNELQDLESDDSSSSNAVEVN